MKNKKFALLLALALLLTGCFSKNQVQPLGLNDSLKAPEVGKLPYEGSWEIQEVVYLGQDQSKKASFAVGDELLLDPSLVALDQQIALLPSFSSKYVHGKDYMAMRFIPENNRIPGDASFYVCMIRDNDAFSMDLFPLEGDKLGFYSDQYLYVLSQKNELVPKATKDRYLSLAQEQKTQAQEKSTQPKLVSLIGIREPRRSDEGILYYAYSTYMIADTPDLDRPQVYKMEDLFLPNADNHYNILSYKAEEADDNNLIMRGSFRFYSTEDKDQTKAQALNDTRGRAISYAHKNIVSFEKPASYPRDSKTRTKYELHFLDQLSTGQPLSIEEIGGKTEKEAMRKQVLAQRDFLNPDMDKGEDLSIDYSNLGIQRRNSEWGFVTSINWSSGNKDYPAKMNLELVPSIPFFDLPGDHPAWSRITNKVPLATSSSMSPAGERLLIKTEDELLYYPMLEKQVANSALVSVQMENGSQIVSLEYYYDDQAKQVKEAFLKEPQSQPHTIYSDQQDRLGQH